ncbi:MAG: hypothetical protein NTV39_00100 [Candidatus Saccharibacteria bacterium]|nr:hypothetical protein [Candidatus Saccharibacteria bacterium]
MKIKQTVLIIASLIGLSSVFIMVPAVSAATCAGVKTSVISCKPEPTDPTPDQTGVWQLLIIAINLMSAGVGIAAVGGVVFGSFMYMTAGGAPDRMKKANMMLTNVALGIIVYAAMWAFLNFIIPGGLFKP